MFLFKTRQTGGSFFVRQHVGSNLGSGQPSETPQRFGPDRATESANHRQQPRRTEPPLKPCKQRCLEYVPRDPKVSLRITEQVPRFNGG